jgi:hypothetical protein
LDDYSKFEDIKRVEEREVREDEKVLIQIEEIKKGWRRGQTSVAIYSTADYPAAAVRPLKEELFYGAWTCNPGTMWNVSCTPVPVNGLHKSWSPRTHTVPSTSYLLQSRPPGRP